MDGSNKLGVCPAKGYEIGWGMMESNLTAKPPLL